MDKKDALCLDFRDKLCYFVGRRHASRYPEERRRKSWVCNQHELGLIKKDTAWVPLRFHLKDWNGASKHERSSRKGDANAYGFIIDSRRPVLWWISVI